MGDYLLVCAAPDDAVALALAADLKTSAAQAGFAVTPLNPATWLGVRGPGEPPHTTIGGWTLIGDVFDRRSPCLPHSCASDPWDYERKLLARIWGRYVGVRFGAKHQLSALLRDPSGALECVAWSQAGLTFVGSSAEDWLVERLRPPWTINAERLAFALHDLVGGTGALLLDGPTALEPGTIQPLPLTEPSATIWSPAEFAMRSLEAAPSIPVAADAVRASVDESVEGLASLPGGLAVEVSGGLDSSIVAASLPLSRRQDVRAWLNAYGSTPESDERAYARDLGEVLGFDPLCMPHATDVITQDWLDALAGGLRPGLNALDYPQDRVWAGLIKAAGAHAVLTGKGGDSVLFQAADTDVFTDLWLERGWRALLHPDIPELAAANEISVWSMISSARRHRRGSPPPLQRAHPFLTPLTGPAKPHPWLANLDAFGPAKAFHIAGVADSVSHHGSSKLSRAVDVRHPLCAQPVVEACLALPTSMLSFGGRDRGLARVAFVERLPLSIAKRRTKGEMTRVYGRMIADNLDVLRPWLADGRLADLGIIDRDATLAELTPEALVWRGQHAAILTAAAFESWVRHWERRLPQSVQGQRKGRGSAPAT